MRNASFSCTFELTHLRNIVRAGFSACAFFRSPLFRSLTLITPLRTLSMRNAPSCSACSTSPEQTCSPPSCLLRCLSHHHLGRRGLEALEDRLYGWRMNNLREVDRRDRSRLITSKASELPKGTAATHRQRHKGPPQTKAWSRPKL